MAMASQLLLLSLYLVATLAVVATASGPDLKGLDLGSGGSICDGTRKALLEARDRCCNDLGERGHCVCSAAKKVADSVTFLQLCDNYGACSAGSWDDVGRKQAAGGGCSSSSLGLADPDSVVSEAGQCDEAVKVVKEHKGCFDNLAMLKKSSGDDSSSFKEALVELGLEDFRAVIEKLLPQGQEGN